MLYGKVGRGWEGGKGHNNGGGFVFRVTKSTINFFGLGTGLLISREPRQFR